MRLHGFTTMMAAATGMLLLLVALPQARLEAGRPGGNSSAHSAAPASVPDDADVLVRLMDSLIVPGMERYHIPGMVVAIVRDSSIVLAKGYGYADIEHRIPFDPDSTVIRIASVSKLFTATAVMQCVDRGALDLRRDINAYLRRFNVEPWAGRPVTLHDLLTHTAGIDDRSIGMAALTQESQIPLGDYLAARLPRRICPPGEVYTYSNLSNALAGFVVEEVTHQDFAAYVRHNILEPLGMRSSDYRLRPDMQPRLAACYTRQGAGFRRHPFDFINNYPSGQMLATGRDMAKFMIAHIQLGQLSGTRILSEKSAAEMHRVQFTHLPEMEHAVGLSFAIVPARTRQVLMHDGGYIGVGSRLCIDPGSRTGFFIACNIFEGTLIDEVSRAILDRAIPGAPPDSTKYPLAISSLGGTDAGEFAGTYRFTRYSHSSIEKAGVLLGMTGQEMTIGRNDEGMILMDRFTGGPRRMAQVRPCVFQSIDDRYVCAFRRDESGRITHLFTNGTTAFEKIAWYETRAFQRSLFGACILFFVVVGVIMPVTGRVRKTRPPSGSAVDPVRWFANATAALFLLYLLGLGIVLGLIIPQEEMALGFAHGIHWSMYIVQTIPILGILSLAGLVGSLCREVPESFAANARRRLRTAVPGIATAVAGAAFTWFLWYWNLVGYQF